MKKQIRKRLFLLTNTTLDFSNQQYMINNMKEDFSNFEEVSFIADIMKDELDIEYLRTFVIDGINIVFIMNDDEKATNYFKGASFIPVKKIYEYPTDDCDKVDLISKDGYVDIGPECVPLSVREYAKRFDRNFYNKYRLLIE